MNENRTEEPNVPPWRRIALRPREAAELLGISERAFRRICHEIPSVRRGRIVLFGREALEDWLRRSQAMGQDRVEKLTDELTNGFLDYDTERT